MSRPIPESELERTTRYMLDNVHGAYESKYSPPHPAHGQPRVNSGTCLLICCYIGALGKALLYGGPAEKREGERVRRDFERFHEFVSRCMPDVEEEWASKCFPPTPKGRLGATEWLYEVFRCGFVHGFYPGLDAAWTRELDLPEYWLQINGLVVLNIDHLVQGFDGGVERFRELAAADQKLKRDFLGFLLAE